MTRKRPPIHRLFASGSVVFLILLVVFIRWSLHHTNYTGLTVSHDLKVIRILSDGPAITSDIQAGDKINALNGRPILHLTDYFNTINSPHLTGQDVVLEVIRGGRNHQVTFTVVSYPLLHASLFGPACGVILLFFGGYVFFKKPEDSTSSLYLALNGCLFVILALSNHLFKHSSAPFLPFFWGLSLIMLIPVNLHFYLVFPEPKKFIQNRPGLLVGLYLIPLFFVVSLVWTSVDLAEALIKGIDCSRSYKRIYGLLVAYLPIAAIYGVCFLISVYHSYKKADSPEKKKQGQIIMIGSMSSLLLAPVVIYAIYQIFTRPEAVSQWPAWGFPLFYGFAVFNVMLMPVSMALAILRYRLWDVDTVINRSLMYMGVSASLIALYFLIVGILGWIFGVVAKPASHLTVLAFALMVAMISEPLRRFIQNLIDRTFNREAYQYGQILMAFSREISAIHNLDMLTSRLNETVAQSLGIRNIAVILRNDKNRFYVAAATGLPDDLARESIQSDKGIAELAMIHKRPFAPEDTTAPSDAPLALKRALVNSKKALASLIVPLTRGDTLLGWISLGRKKSDTLYTSQDRQLLETLANQAAVAVTNALAFGEIDTLNRGLQEKIAKVEEQRAEIERLQEKLLEENLYLKEQITGNYNFTDIIGANHGLRQVMEMVANAAQSDATILLYGESGTGKELIARAIHFNSHLKDGPFIKVNCAALSEGVLQSELFGHEKGAFTGAHERRRGRFELADGGTILLDEIGDIPPATQVLLLRVLQEQEFERVGGSKTIRVQVRILAATNRNLEEAVRQGNFRADLYYRLKVITIEVPPLRKRREDIMELALHFVEKYSRKYGKRILKIDEPVIEQFKHYAWPGNVREMENIIERAVVIGKSDILQMSDIPMELQILNKAPLSQTNQTALPGEKSHNEIIGDIEYKRLIDALEAAGGNKSEAARCLGLKRSTFFNKLKKYGLVSTGRESKKHNGA